MHVLHANHPLVFNELAQYICARHAYKQNDPLPDRLNQLATHDLIGTMQMYSLNLVIPLTLSTHRNYRHELASFFQSDLSTTGGLPLSSEFSFALHELLADLTFIPAWRVGDTVAAIEAMTKSSLQSIIVIYNQFCKLKGRKDKLSPLRISWIGGIKRTVFLLMTYSSTLELIRTDIEAVKTLQTERHVFEAPALQQNEELPPDTDELEVQDGPILFRPECAMCGQILTDNSIIPRYSKCTHQSSFHWACYSTYFDHWKKSKSVTKPKEPKCPVYGCGWSYVASQLDLISCNPEIFLPPEADPPAGNPSPSAPRPDVMIVE